MLGIAIEIVGWVGAVLMLTAYFLLSAGRLDARSPTYQWLNVAGGAGFVANSGWNGAWPSAALNVVWVFIGLFAVIRISTQRRAAI
jgi:hypothetical protein